MSRAPDHRSVAPPDATIYNLLPFSIFILLDDAGHCWRYNTSNIKITTSPFSTNKYLLSSATEPLIVDLLPLPPDGTIAFDYYSIRRRLSPILPHFWQQHPSPVRPTTRTPTAHDILFDDIMPSAVWPALGPATFSLAPPPDWEDDECPHHSSSEGYSDDDGIPTATVVKKRRGLGRWWIPIYSNQEKIQSTTAGQWNKWEHWKHDSNKNLQNKNNKWKDNLIN